jgi:hypothetical protein
MYRHNIGHVAVAALGFLLGAMFAMSIAPGDALLLIGTGIVFGFSARALFDQHSGGDWFWSFARSTGRKTLGGKPRHRPAIVVHGVGMIQKPQQQAGKQALGILKSCGVGPSPELQASPDSRNFAAEDLQADLDDINAMMSEGGPTGLIP